MEIKNIHDYWSFDYPERDNQTLALDWLAKQKAKFLILEAPVGSGKSNIGVTYSRYLGQRTPQGDSYILTPQRILQKQYDDSFADDPDINLKTLYGKSNYTCGSKKTTCDIGSIVKPRCAQCPHADARKAAVLASNTVLNYTLALSSFAYTPVFKPRKLMILDEAHTLEEHLVNFDAVGVFEYRCKKHDMKFKKHNKLRPALQWVKDYYLNAINTRLADMEHAVDHLYDKAGTDLTRREIKQLREVAKFGEYVDEIRIMSLRTPDYVEDNFVLVNDNVSFTFKRLYGSYSFDRIIKPQAERFLLMSSTILDKDGFCRDLGIDRKDAAFLSLDSDFPVENRQTFYMPQMKMNYGWNGPERTKERKHTSDAIEKICLSHSEEKGIIHTANFAIAKWLIGELKHKIPHEIFEHGADVDLDRNTVIDQFMEYNHPAILISPSSTEGLDLKEDLGRFAIFAKVPYGFLGDQWIKRRMEMSSEWYSRRAMINIIQGGGRIVRSETDTGAVYITDQSFNYLYSQTIGITPKWWRDAFVRI